MVNPVWNVVGLVLLIVEAVVHRNAPGFSLLVAASALWIAAAAFTFTFMFSLNSRLARPDSTSSPEQSLLDYKQWSSRHLPRLLVLAAALLCLLLAKPQAPASGFTSGASVGSAATGSGETATEGSALPSGTPGDFGGETSKSVATTDHNRRTP